MPAGVTTGPVHCRRCNNQAFASFSELRKHQWKKHTEQFENSSGGSKGKWTKERRARFMATIEAKKTENALLVSSVGTVRGYIDNTDKPDMTVKELLVKLKSQQTFLNDVVNLVEGLAKA